MPRRLKISLGRGHAMQVTRIAIGNKKLVYAILTPKPHRYPWGRSRVVYIGTTKNGVSRVAQSAASKSDDVLRRLRGVKDFYVRIITCTARKNVKSWKKLERALILVFRKEYGDIPYCNKQGTGYKWTDELDYFKETRLKAILESLEKKL